MSPRSNYSTPRWVKVFGIIVIILILLVVVVLVTGIGGDHGPGRHLPAGDADGTPSASLSAHTSARELGVLRPGP